MTIATFLGRSYLNLQIVEYGKIRIPLFCLFFKLKITKIFVYEYFLVFLMVHVYSTAYDDKTLTVHRKLNKDSKYVESFCVSTMVFKLEGF